MTNGDVAFDCEGSDGEDAGVTCCFSQHDPQHAKGVAKDPGIRIPEAVELLRQAHQKEKEVGYGEVEEAEVGGGVHEAVVEDHHACEHVAQHSGEENDDVDGAEENDLPAVLPLRT